MVHLRAVNAFSIAAYIDDCLATSRTFGKKSVMTNAAGKYRQTRAINKVCISLRICCKRSHQIRLANDNADGNLYLTQAGSSEPATQGRSDSEDTFLPFISIGVLA